MPCPPPSPSPCPPDLLLGAGLITQTRVLGSDPGKSEEEVALTLDLPLYLGVPIPLLLPTPSHHRFKVFRLNRENSVFLVVSTLFCINPFQLTYSHCN